MPISNITKIKGDDTMSSNSVTMSPCIVTAQRNVTTPNDDTAKIPNFLYRLSKKYEKSLFTLNQVRQGLYTNKYRPSLERTRNNLKDLIASGECREVNDGGGRVKYCCVKACTEITKMPLPKIATIIIDLQMLYEQLVRIFLEKGRLVFTASNVSFWIFKVDNRPPLVEITAKLEELVNANKIFKCYGSRNMSKYSFNEQVAQE